MGNHMLTKLVRLFNINVKIAVVIDIMPRILALLGWVKKRASLCTLLPQRVLSGRMLIHPVPP